MNCTQLHDVWLQSRPASPPFVGGEFSVALSLTLAAVTPPSRGLVGRGGHRRGQAKFWSRSVNILRYALTGGLATAAHYLVMFALVEGQLAEAPAASMAGALCGALVAYAGNRHCTFADPQASHRRALPRFATVALLGAALNGAAVWLALVALGLHYLLAQVLATLIVLVLGYRLNRTWSFS